MSLPKCIIRTNARRILYSRLIDAINLLSQDTTSHTREHITTKCILITLGHQLAACSQNAIESRGSIFVARNPQLTNMRGFPAQIVLLTHNSLGLLTILTAYCVLQRGIGKRICQVMAYIGNNIVERILITVKVWGCDVAFELTGTHLAKEAAMQGVSRTWSI